ncbi:Hypothetical predicted protein [Paramuricea clavata]|uniref:Daxx histone-binding domain-containing protein n=1 Tax=Paramuricea clavata TaxID=317549 RepID=A0A6S7G476_PARCT|nr:Hypothetical predicted protein [Paramuricea clavata]
MANIANVFTENSSKNQSSFEVITLSSDEEQSEQSNEDVSFLFKRFILACRPHVRQEAIKDARSLFTEVQGKLTASHDLVAMLERYVKEIKKENAGLYFSLICRTLKAEKSINNGVVLNSGNGLTNAGENLDVVNKVPKSVTFCDVSEARGFEPTAKLSTNQNNSTTSAPQIATISDDDDFVGPKPSKMPTERIENIPSTSSACQDATANKTKGKISTRTLTVKQRKKLAARLKQRLKEISNEIKILNRAELTLEEMDMCDSTYIKENQLKKKFEKTWTKLCKILGREPNTGRVVEKPIRASSTGYSMIDKAVAKFLKEKPGSFPDYFDIRDIVMKTNKKYDLRMSPQVLNGLIADIFTDIGNKLQRRRERDLLFNFGSHLLDDFKTEDDPALSNKDLALQLEKNRRISKRNLKHVYTKYAHLERYEIDEKTRKSGSSRVNKDMSSESGTSDDEQDHQRSRNHNRYARLDRQEVIGKSKKGLSSTPGSSRGLDGDICSESGSSDNEQDIPRAEFDDSIVVVDSDVPTSQELSFVSVSPKLSTDMLSTSHVEQSLSDTDRMEVSLSDNERPESPIFPLTCLTQNETGTSEQTLSTFDPDCSNNDTQTNQQTFSSSSDCEIINNPSEHKQFVTLANEPSVSEIQLNTDYDCEIVNEPTEQLVTMKQFEPVNEPSVSDKLNTDDDYEIVNNPKQQSVTMKQLDEPVNESSAQLDQPVNEPSAQLDESINEPSVSDSQPNTDDDCKIVNNPKQQSVTMKQLDQPASEPSVNEPHPDDCLIIDDDQEDSASTSCSEPLKIPTSTPSDELIKTLNVLREVFRTRFDPRNESTRDESTESRDESMDESSRAESTESRNTNLVSQTVQNTVCSSEDSTMKDTAQDLNLKSGHSNSVSQTDSSKAWSSKSSSDNTEDLNVCGNSDLDCVTIVSDSDVIMSNNDQYSTSNSVKDGIGTLTYCPIETSHTIARTSSNSPPKHTQSLSTEAPTNVVFSRKTITSNLCHPPLSPKPSTSETSNVVNPRKRKASTELAIQIPKQSVKCLEHLAWCLKNKRLKLPDAWVNSKKAEKNSDVSSSKPTTSKESSAIRSDVPALSKPTTSSAVRSDVPDLSKPTTSSTVSQTLSENNSQLVNGKAKIDLQHRHVFREKTLNALQVPKKLACNNNVNSGFQSDDNNVNSGLQSDDINSSAPASDDADKREVIIIDD